MSEQAVERAEQVYKGFKERHGYEVAAELTVATALFDVVDMAAGLARQAKAKTEKKEVE